MQSIQHSSVMDARAQKQFDCREGSLGLVCSALGLGQAIQATLLDLHIRQQLRTTAHSYVCLAAGSMTAVLLLKITACQRHQLRCTVVHPSCFLAGLIYTFLCSLKMRPWNIAEFWLPKAASPRMLQTAASVAGS